MEASINGTRMHWREVGRGEPVLFVHGFPFHGGLWEEQLERLPRRWRFLAPDLRGFGRSEAGETKTYSLDLLADDLAALLDSLGLERAAVCGLSMGGYVAFALWRRHRERIGALVLCDTRAAADTEEARAGRRQLAERVRREGTSAAAEELLPKLLSAKTRRERPEAVRRLRVIMESVPPETVVRALEAMAERPDRTTLLPAIDAPVLVVMGSEDALIPRDEGELLARSVRDGRLVVIPGTGHVPPLEDPEAFNRALVHFLEAVQ